jgi:hypothetical protein
MTVDQAFPKIFSAGKIVVLTIVIHFQQHGHVRNVVVTQGGSSHLFFDERTGHIGWHSRISMNKRSFDQDWLGRV